MELFSPEFFSALLAIIVIDLVLAGDNAIVIAMAARNLPSHLQKKAIVWGVVGAIAVRSAMTLVVVYLLKIPGLMLIGGLLLVWIAYKLLNPAEDGDGKNDHASTSFWEAMKTIAIADAVMGLDNVLAINNKVATTINEDRTSPKNRNSKMMTRMTPSIKTLATLNIAALTRSVRS